MRLEYKTLHSTLQRAVLGEKPNEGGSDSSVGLEFEFGKILGGKAVWKGALLKIQAPSAYSTAHTAES